MLAITFLRFSYNHLPLRLFAIIIMFGTINYRGNFIFASIKLSEEVIYKKKNYEEFFSFYRFE